MKQLYVLFIFVLFHTFSAFGQKKITGYGRWQVTTYLTYNGGWGVSFGRGMWVERKHIQPAMNISVNGSFARHNLGNKNRAGSRMLITSILSPMVIVGGKRNGYYEPLNSFYFGNSNGVVSNFSHHLAIGSNFVLNPKSNRSLIDGKLSTENIYTNKNRTQQLMYLGVRLGGKYRENGMPWSFKFNIYEDYIISKTVFLWFADHFDRFYTGGGNIEFSLYPQGFSNGPIKLTIYNDVYTGTFERDMFDFPDIYDLKEDKFSSNSTFKRRNARYVAQEPGQKLFNSGRVFGFVELPLTGRAFLNQPTNIRFMFGKDGGTVGMWFQDIIHDGSTIDKVNPNVANPELLYPRKGNRSHFERLHHFYPISQKGRWMIGGSINLAPLKTHDFKLPR